MKLVARRHAAVADPDPRGVRERDRRDRRDAAARRTASCTCSRSPRGGDRARRSTTSTRSPRARRSSPTSSPAAATSRRTCSRPAASALVARELVDARAHAREARGRRRPHARRGRGRRARAPGQKVVVSWDDPLKPTGGLAILRGNLAPEGCVVKLAGHERAAPPRAGARVRLGGGRASPRSRRARSSRATSS